jgi:dTDP-4-dehydrorhamnose reductase
MRQFAAAVPPTPAQRPSVGRPGASELGVDHLMRLLVTGGSGYLGSEILRRVPGAVGTAYTGAGDVRLDVRDAAAVARVVDSVRPACVIHTAYARGGEAAWETNVDGARNVAAAAAAAGARLVHLSTDVVFAGDAGRPYVETDATSPVSAYGRSKAQAEAAVRAVHAGATIVRTSLIYGGAQPSAHERAVLDALDSVTGMAFFADEIRCPAHVGDLAAAVLELSHVALAGPLHVAGPDAVSRYEFARLVAASKGRDPAAVAATLSAALPDPRPRDCRLDCTRAQTLLDTRMRGVREVLQGPSRSTTQPPSALV